MFLEGEEGGLLRTYLSIDRIFRDRFLFAAFSITVEERQRGRRRKLILHHELLSVLSLSFSHSLSLSLSLLIPRVTRIGNRTQT